ncbi:Phage virion morphogenesis family protein [compost metagenome]
MASSALDFDVRGLLDAQNLTRLLDLSQGKRRSILNKTSKRVRTQSRTRIRNQSDLGGQAFAPRKAARKGKMLRGLGKGLSVTRLSGTEAVLGWGNRLVASIAGEHQHGHVEKYTAQKVRRRGKTLDPNAPATRDQARALRNAGYRVRRGKRWLRPSMSWIQSQLKAGQAGLILSLLEHKPKHSSWDVTLPARSFLGATPDDVREMVATVLSQVLNTPT